MNHKLILFILSFCFFSNVGAKDAWIGRHRAALYERPGAVAWGYLPPSSPVTILSQTTDKKYTRVRFQIKGQGPKESYILSEALEKSNPTHAEAEKQSQSKTERIEDPWSLGFGFGGYSSDGQSAMQISAELRVSMDYMDAKSFRCRSHIWFKYLFWSKDR